MLYLTTFVVLKYDLVDFHLLKELFPDCKLIFWDVDRDDLPYDWERKFLVCFDFLKLEKRDLCILVVLIKKLT